MAVEHTHRNYAIAAYLVHGYTPWGHSLAPGERPFLSDCDGDWIMCCGHVLTSEEAEDWIASGVGQEGKPDRFGRRTMTSGPLTERWLGSCWDAIAGEHGKR